MTFQHVDLVAFPTRADRVRYMADIFAPAISGRVLDIGCHTRALEAARPDLQYVGVDVAGQPDVRLDLESVDRLPFADRSFDAVICCDVLEHLDNLHLIFAELVRVSRRYVVVSLPNCWTAARRPVARGKGAIGWYGLPPTPPADRHKWFFALSEARDFALAMAEKHALSIAEMRVAEKPRPALLRWARRLRQPRQIRYLNQFAHTLFILFERQG
jgi:SAM-dependent methyltransferase